MEARSFDQETRLQCMKTLNGMFLNKYDLLVKYSVAARVTYLKQIYTRLLNHVDTDYWYY